MSDSATGCELKRDAVEGEWSMRVERLDRPICKAVIEGVHYSGRLGVFWEGFGLFTHGGKLVGVCCYGQPSAPIQRFAFTDRDFRLYELTRLVVDSGIKNGASFLISQSLKMLRERPSAVISYADTAHGHTGIVYQATNWVYTGAVVSHDNLYVVDGEALHPMTLRDRYGITKPAAWAKENGIERVKPKPKQRYFTFVGNKTQVKHMKRKLKYEVIDEYPKADRSAYDTISCMDALNLV